MFEKAKQRRDELTYECHTMDEVKEITEIQMTWGIDYADSYTVDASLDGKNWFSVIGIKNGMGDEEVLEMPPNTKARYIRFGNFDFPQRTPAMLGDIRVYGTELEEMLRKYISPEKIIIENETECCEKNTEASAQSGHIDVDLGMKYCGDSKDMYLEILTVYCEMHDELKADLDKALAADNWKNYTVNIHSLKSNSLNVGASALSKMCLELEKAGKAISAGEDSDANTDLIRTKHPGVMAAYAEAVAEAKNILNKGIQ